MLDLPSLYRIELSDSALRGTPFPSNPYEIVVKSWLSGFLLLLIDVDHSIFVDLQELSMEYVYFIRCIGKNTDNRMKNRCRWFGFKQRITVFTGY